MTEIFPTTIPTSIEDTVFGVREDLVMKYVEKAADTFPEGYNLSGKVNGPYLLADFDLKLVRAQLVDLFGQKRARRPIVVRQAGAHSLDIALDRCI